MSNSRVTVIICLSMLVGCKSKIPVLPVGSNPYVCKLEIEQLTKENVATPLPEGVPVVSTTRNSGFAMQIGFEVCGTVPTQEGSRAVSASVDWPLMVVIYPKGEDDTSPQVLRGSVYEIAPPGRKRTREPIPAGFGGFWHSCKVNEWKMPKQPIGQSHAKARNTSQMLWHWTFICADKDQVGEFVVEVRLFPTSRWISAVRSELGDPIVLKRFILKVTDDKL